ncbi:MAG: hypothetical protein HY905_13675 [Deltaproteobacteria bacterium]|nr:hypothetical protein [Deltaproteobacteria bacterium]
MVEEHGQAAAKPKEKADEEKGLDLFELCSATLLGLAAIGGAWSAYQGDLWGGQSVEAYGEAATMTTQAAGEATTKATSVAAEATKKMTEVSAAVATQTTGISGEAAVATTQASTEFGLQITVMARDSALDIDAKKLLFEAATTRDRTTAERQFTVAKYLYTQQLSDEAYQSLGLPAEFRTEDQEKAFEIPLEALAAAADKEVATDAYIESMLGPAVQKFEAAETGLSEGFAAATKTLTDGFGEAATGLTDGFTAANAMLTGGFAKAGKRFDEGRDANNTGDKFGLDSIFYTVCLFLAGIALVFKTKVRWAFFAIGLTSFVGATAYLFTIPWA